MTIILNKTIILHIYECNFYNVEESQRKTKTKKKV